VGWGYFLGCDNERTLTKSSFFAADEATQQKMVEEAVGKGLGRDVLPLKPTLVTVKFA